MSSQPINSIDFFKSDILNIFFLNEGYLFNVSVINPEWGAKSLFSDINHFLSDTLIIKKRNTHYMDFRKIENIIKKRAKNHKITLKKSFVEHFNNYKNSRLRNEFFDENCACW